mgnify:CR=1 FL=1|jgi:hypothetical protein
MAELIILLFIAVSLGFLYVGPRVLLSEDWKYLSDSWEPRKGVIKTRKHGAWVLGERRDV